MTVYITGESARAYWDTITSLEAQTARSSRTALTDAAATPKALKGCGVPREAIVNSTLHVLVGANGDRRNSKHVTSHSFETDLPRGALRRVSDTVEVVSPEFLFVLMASSLPLWEAIRLGFELCGTYAVNPKEPGKNHRKPLTTRAKLERFLQAAGPIHGSKKAQRALKYVEENSNSPMETILAMLLCLPSRHGGYGLPKPEMNHVIKLGEEQSRLTGQRKFVCDLYWPAARYALEYYGREWHTGAEQVAYDAKRAGLLQFRGISIHVVTYEQLETPEDVALLAKMVAKALGARLRKPSESCHLARRHLHAHLISNNCQQTRNCHSVGA